MKNPVLIFAGMVLMLFTLTIGVNAQDEEKSSKFTTGADLYSNYVWRGTRFGQGPHLQPTVKYSNGGLTIGIWGSFDLNGYSETDPYISYSMPFGLSLGVTDYYYPGLPLFEISDTAGSHALELNAGYSYKGLTLSANYILNEAGGAASAGGDMYFQAGYGFNAVSLWVGAGNGWHTSDGEFKLCNLGIGTTKTIIVSDNFSIPVTGQVILNPDREQLFLVIGFTF
ncbi:MAG: hypothetical protein MUC93_01595 [Bacteroidales bacterium]|jgi:hypothetical protein|nr:hypothetical protein [Bacteroidales bacterium]